MTGNKQCPKCYLINPPETQRCDCGWDFDSKNMKHSLLKSKQQSKQKLTPDQRTPEKNRKLFDEAISIVNEYGRILEESKFSASPESMLSFAGDIDSEGELAFTKQLIKKCLKGLYDTLKNGNNRPFFYEYFPDMAEQILSEKYIESLGGAYVLLSKFIPDDEANFVMTVEKRMQGATQSLNRDENVEILEKMRSDIDEHIKISERISTKSKLLLGEWQKFTKESESQRAVSKQVMLQKSYNPMSEFWIGVIFLIVVTWIFYQLIS